MLYLVASCSFFFFFFMDTATTEIYTYGHTLSLHDALPIFRRTATDLEERLGDRAPQRAGQDPDLLDHPGPRVLRPGPAVGPADPVRRERCGGRGGAHGDGGEDGAEHGVGEGGAEHEEQHHHGGEVAEADLPEAGLDQPLLHHRAVISTAPDRRPEPHAAPAEGQRGVGVVDAERRRDREQQRGHRWSGPERTSRSSRTLAESAAPSARVWRAWSGTPSMLRRS